MSCDNPNCRKMGCAVTYILPEGMAEEINMIGSTVQNAEDRKHGPVEKDGTPPKVATPA